MKPSRIRLDQVAELSLGKMLDKNKNRGEPQPYLANINVRWGNFDLDDLRTMRFLPSEAERYGLRSGDIVMCEGGEPGRCSIWRDQVPGMMLQKALHRIRPNAGIDPAFLYYQLSHLGRSGGLAPYFTGSTIKHLPREQLAKVEVTVPPIEDQRGIAAILGAYDELMEVNRRRIAVLEGMARGLFQEWFVRFRFPGHESHSLGETPAGPLPEGWCLSTLGELADVQWGDTATTKSAYKDEGFLAYSASGPDGFMDHFDVDRVGVVISAIGAQCGKTWLARGRRSCIKNTMRFWSNSEDVSTEYLYLATHGSEKWPRRGAAQPFISLGDARRIPIVLPSAQTSVRFSAVVSQLFELIAAIAQQNTKLGASRDLLLPRLISGLGAQELHLKAVA